MIRRLLGCLLVCAGLATALAAQDQANLVITGNGLRKLNLALPDFIVPAGDATAAGLQATFNSVLAHDLTQSARVTVIGKSLYPGPGPAQPADLNAAALQAWSAPPASAQRLVAGSLAINAGALAVKGNLFDLTQPASPYVVGRTMVDKPTPAGARLLAHQLADVIVTALGGTPFATSHIAWVHITASGSQDVWISDYDGNDPHQLTHFGGFINGPRFSPDGSRLTYSGQRLHENHQIHMVSLITGQEISFPTFHGENGPPSWSPDGKKLAFSSSMEGGGRSKIFTVNADGSGLRRITNENGADDLEPVWNPATGAQIAFCSDRGTQPHLYVMNADGSQQHALVVDGFAADPAWSPNGLLLAFAWVRHAGGEDSGAFDVYVWDFTAPPGPQQYTQFTHNQLDNASPSWGPDSSRIVFESGLHSAKQLITVLANGAGTDPVQLTSQGRNEQPSWSVH